MNYEVAYDIQQAWYPAWWVFAIGIAMFCLGLGSVLFEEAKVFRLIMGRPAHGSTSRTYVRERL
jgi:hypothetical protein